MKFGYARSSSLTFVYPFSPLFPSLSLSYPIYHTIITQSQPPPLQLGQGLVGRLLLPGDGGGLGGEVPVEDLGDAPAAEVGFGLSPMRMIS